MRKVTITTILTFFLIALFVVRIEADTNGSVSATSSGTSKDTSESVASKEKKIIRVGEPAEEALRQTATWANDQTAMPTPGADGRVVFTFGESYPTIICSPLHICDLELEAGETVNDLNLADKVRWELRPSISGKGASSTVHVIIKPKDINLETNVVIATDRRTYHIDLVSRDHEYVVFASFRYPENQKRAWAAQRAEMAKRKAKKDALVTAEMPLLSADNLNFNYETRVQKGRGRFVPVRVFDDGAKVYIQMPGTLSTDEAPSLLLVGTDGKDQLVNYRVKHGYYIVDRLFDRAVLVAGAGGDQDKVSITHCNKYGFFGGCKI